ncbi:putative cop9 signalosome complex subunit [Phaeomoniella chlamydospora]|uniref:Protein CSN12 homolog n=1 Tax=Phaeomoniella chlamydospora TaxID=158046 RepID=A0A0G2GGP3_PHACM|nr:putative cop9 signalosome complex subunit [Phaeomoniella chlamydospora]
MRYYIVQDRSSGVKLSKAQSNTWIDIFVSLWTTAKEVVGVLDGSPSASWVKAFDAYKELANHLLRGYTSNGGQFEAWTVPCLYIVGKYLRLFAVKADAEAKSQDSVAFGDGFQDDIMGNFGKNEKLEQAAWIINRMFTLCLNDRSPIEESRKWGIYGTTGLLFKTYFRLNSVNLTKNVLRALDASQDDLPPLQSFPISHVVTFKYYRGVIAFLDENYSEAEQYLTEAWQLCHKGAHRNRELILTYLIPCHLLTTHTLPRKELLEPFPRLEALFRPLCQCIKKGDLAGFDAAMLAGEQEFVKRRIYLTLERGRDIALRNLCRKVFIAGGFDESKNGESPIRRTRVPMAEFAAAMRLGNQTSIDDDEVECFLANLIYKNLMKGYIARERGIVVLSKGGTAFPGTGL